MNNYRTIGGGCYSKNARILMVAHGKGDEEWQEKDQYYLHKRPKREGLN
jgi:hypothetical protein